MIKKHYTADIIDTEGNVSKQVGNCIQTVWFWQSAKFAYNQITDYIATTNENKRFQIVNFHRVK